MIRFFSTLLSLCLAVSAFAKGPSELDRVSQAMAGNEAQFVQRFTPKGFRNSQIESGTVIFGSLPMMRWSYVKPEAKTFVFNGSDSWLYVPGDRQVTTARLDDARRRELPFLVLGDPAARERSFLVSESRRGGNITTTLRPRDPAASIRDVAITSSASTHLISRIEYGDREGNRTAFEISGYHQRSAPADTFRFTPPAGVQVINQ